MWSNSLRVVVGFGWKSLLGVNMATYESPRIVELGSLAELTQGSAAGGFIDGDISSDDSRR